MATTTARVFFLSKNCFCFLFLFLGLGLGLGLPGLGCCFLKKNWFQISDTHFTLYFYFFFEKDSD
jgi:hypothetical protein